MLKRVKLNRRSYSSLEATKKKLEAAGQTGSKVYQHVIATMHEVQVRDSRRKLTEPKKKVVKKTVKKAVKKV